MAGPLKIVVMDPDPATAESVRKAFEGRGHEIIPFADGAEAMDWATRNAPDIMILEIILPMLDGLMVLRTLRTKPEYALVPAIILAPKTAVEGRLLGFGISADDFLPKPIDIEELDLRVTLAIKTRDKLRNQVRPVQQPSGDWSVMMTGLRGNLDQIGLPSLLSLMDMEQKTGVLVVFLEDTQDKARIHMCEGRVFKAAIDKKESPKNAELIYDLLCRTSGKFDFRPCAVAADDEIRTPTAHLMLEGARRFDETQRRVREAAPPLDETK